MPELPRLLNLWHAIPFWVGVGSLLFVTICCERRGVNQLCLPKAGEALLHSAAYYHESQRWWLKLFLLMPDHLHALMAVPKGESLPVILRMWKGYQTKTLGIQWQAGFFDHRLRSDESEQEKTDYIRMNPVRAGLVTKPGDWPYVWPKKQGESSGRAV